VPEKQLHLKEELMKKEIFKPKLSKEQKQQLAALAALPDEKIDTSDANEIIDWSNAKRGLFYRPNKQPRRKRTGLFIENTNGLIRQFFPKGLDFANITPAQVQKVEDLLNNRPRKTLGYLSPNEVFNTLTDNNLYALLLLKLKR